jgi:hypothetical protein
MPEASGPAEAPAVPETASIEASGAKGPVAIQAEHGAPFGIDKGALTLAEPRRHRNKDHLKFVAKQACIVVRAGTFGSPPPGLHAAAGA